MRRASLPPALFPDKAGWGPDTDSRRKTHPSLCTRRPVLRVALGIQSGTASYSEGPAPRTGGGPGLRPHAGIAHVGTCMARLPACLPPFPFCLTSVTFISSVPCPVLQKAPSLALLLCPSSFEASPQTDDLCLSCDSQQEAENTCL